MVRDVASIDHGGVRPPLPRPLYRPLYRSLYRLVALLCAGALVLAGCGSIPRGAAISSEVTATGGGLTGRTAPAADFVVYPVTRAFLPQVATWPVTGERLGNWPQGSHGSRQRVIRPGDTLSITVWDASETSLITTPGARATPLEMLRVSPQGSIFVPYAGSVQVAGNTPEAARAIVERAVETFVPSAQVQLMMTEGVGNSVTVVSGAAANGRYTLPDNAYGVLDLLADAGGISATLSNPKVKLHRGSEFFAISAGTLYESPRLDATLRPGDQIIIEEDKRFFLSLGASGTEQVHAFTKDFISAAEAMAIAGGVNDGRGDPGGILILRDYPTSALAAGTRGPQKQRVVFSIDLTTADGLFSAREFRMNSEDLIYVSEAPVTSAATIFAIVGSAFGLINTVSN
ncbi:MAG: polysaccharide biosynthesis/export family protein [Pseudomonadota bacterium]